MWPQTKQRRLLVPRPNGPAQRWTRGQRSAVSRRVRVTALRFETDDTLTLQLAPIDGKPLAFRAGQYLTHCFEIDGRTVKRAYSLSAAEGQAPACTIKLLAGGVASNYLRQTLRAGDEYAVLGPSGDFVLDDSEVPLAFVAGGSGITPVISLIETALSQQPQRSITLLYASRSTAQVIFAARLAALAQQYPSLRVRHALSAEQGRLNAARVAAHFSRIAAQTQAYLCGPDGLMDGAEQSLRAAGLAARDIRRERFLAAAQTSAAAPTEPQPIEFSRSGRTVTQQPGETVLEAGLRAGIRLDFSCTVGGCGACRLRVSDGAVAINEPNCLTPEERAAGDILACSTYAASRLTVEA